MAEAAVKERPSKVVTGKVRFSFPHVFKARRDEDSGRETYGIMILIPKKDKATIAKINAAIEHVKNDPKSKEVWGSKFLSSMKTPLRDGDEERDTEEHEEYKGHYFINANTTMKPQVVDEDRDEILDPSEIYSGCYGRISMNMYAFKQKGGVGIAAGLNNVQKLADGEPLSGRSTAEDDFGPESEEEEDFLD